MMMRLQKDYGKSYGTRKWGLDLKEIKLILEGVEQETVIEEKVNKINNKIRVLEEQKKVIEYIQRYSIPVKSEENNKTFKDQIKQIRKEQGMQEGRTYEGQ